MADKHSTSIGFQEVIRKRISDFDVRGACVDILIKCKVTPDSRCVNVSAHLTIYIYKVFLKKLNFLGKWEIFHLFLQVEEILSVVVFSFTVIPFWSVPKKNNVGKREYLLNLTFIQSSCSLTRGEVFITFLLFSQFVFCVVCFSQVLKCYIIVEL